MKAVTYSREDHAFARKAGFRRRKPKKGKKSDKVHLENLNAWATDLKAKAKDGRKQAAEKKAAKAALAKFSQNGK